jgi:lipoprotein-anchoring transpeptidase ErfK/SrfK
MEKIIFLIMTIVLFSGRLWAEEKTLLPEAAREAAPSLDQAQNQGEEKSLPAPSPVEAGNSDSEIVQDNPSEEQVHTVVPGDSLYVIAMKYKTTIANIKQANGLKKDVIYPGMKLNVAAEIYSIQVDKSDNLLSLSFNGKLVKQYNVATGKDGSTPEGEFKIVNKLENPTWYHAGAVVPPDSPENILGSRWLGFDRPGYGIHGTTLPETVGQQSSAGCVRMVNKDVEELSGLIPVGTKVTITQ